MIVIGDYIINASRVAPVVVTKEVAPIEDVASRTGHYSKTFTILGDAESNRVFNHLFDVNISVQNETTENFTPDFNPNLKASFQYWVDDFVAFDGFCKLDDVVVDNEKIEYRLTAFGGSATFFHEIREKRLEDLDMSDYNHTYSDANIRGSWTNDYTDGYVYPMINYGHRTTTKLSPGLNGSGWLAEDFRCAVFVKAIWDQIFEEAGWSYDSSFLSTNHFEKLIIPSPSNGVTLSYEAVDDLSFNVGSNSSYVVSNSLDLTSAPVAASRFEFDVDSGSILSNTLQNTNTSEWDTTNYIYEADNSSYMQFRFFFDGDVEYVGSVSFGNPFNAMLLTFAVVRGRGGTYSVIDSKQTVVTFSSSISPGSIASLPLPINFTTQEHRIEAGDEVFLAFTSVEVGFVQNGSFTGSYFIANGDVELTVDAGSLFGNVVSDKLELGNTMLIANIMPDMTQRDFISAFAKMFNLYIEQTGTKTLLIEPRDEGYLTQTKNDWTDKLDYSQENKIVPMGELNKKEYNFTYEEDEDVWAKVYRNSYDEEYGSKRVFVDNDFQTEKYDIKLPFPSTILSQATVSNDMVLSDMSFVGDDGIFETQEAKPRVLYYGGLISCDSWVYRSKFINGTNYYFTSYPYAGHLDNPNSPTYDYLWFFPKNIFYSRNYGSQDYPQYPNRNLYNLYWYRFIEEIKNKDSRVFEGYFDLSYHDWVNVSFREIYHFLDCNWRLLMVEDYDLEKGGLTKCKFLKVGAYVNPTYDRYKLNTGYGQTDDNGDTLPSMIRIPSKDGNKFPRENYTGANNDVGGTAGFVYGDANLVGTDVEGFALISSSGNVVQASGAMLVNTNGRVVNSFNEVWVNNINQERYVDITLTYTEVQAIFGTPIQVKAAPDSNQYYEVTRVSLKYEHNGTNYVTAGADIHLKCGDSGLLLATQQDDPLSGSVDTNYLLAIAATTLTDARDLDDRLGEPLELSSSAAITGNGGDVTFRIYYKIVEI